MHIFPYSLREGTAAAKLPNHVSTDEKNQRAHIMLNVAEAMKKDFCTKYVGRELPVLFEQKKDGRWSGMTENYIEVRADGENLRGKTVPVKIIAYNEDGGYLEGYTAEPRP